MELKQEALTFARDWGADYILVSLTYDRAPHRWWHLSLTEIWVLFNHL